MTMIKNELDAHTSKVVARLGADAAAILFDGQIGQARTVVNGALDKGQKAPSFELPDADGNLIALGIRLKNGPVVVTFYRGGWCPYCNIALRALQSHLPEIKRLGGSLIAISPELPDQSLSTREKLALGFDVLSDRDNVVARRFGLVYRVSDAARQRLLELGRDLVAHNGSQTWELPITATYVIDPNGLIVFAHVDADYRDRLDPALIVEALRSNTSSIHEDR
jgi:peroxiredoxin